MIKLIHGDCLEKMEDIPIKYIDLIVIDPPYNIKKANWDKFKSLKEYVDFMSLVFKHCERVLKDNGSFYFFHNDFLKMVELQNYININTKFVFNSLIHWIKPSFRPLSWKNPRETSNLRSWFNCVEYCLYYTFQDKTGLQQIEKEYIAPRNPFAIELKKARIKKGVSVNQVAEYGKFYGNVNHGGAVTNWEKGYNVPLECQWNILCKNLPIKRQEYEELRQEYEELRQEHESLRYVHNIDKSHNNIWESKEHNNGKYHPTQKPIDIIERIINTSSNENDIVLDFFMGSGTTGVACKRLNRNFIGIELDENYFNIAEKRINESVQSDLPGF